MRTVYSLASQRREKDVARVSDAARGIYIYIITFVTAHSQVANGRNAARALARGSIGVDRRREALAAGVPVAVCSTSSEQAVGNLVRVLMGDERHAKIPIFAGDCVANKKPAPDVYNLAAAELGIADAAKVDCVVVEDSTIGLAAAKAAGMQCIVTKSSYAAREDFAKADRVVDDLEAGAVGLEAIRALAP